MIQVNGAGQSWLAEQFKLTDLKCPLLAISGHLMQCGIMSAFGGKADIDRGSAECLLMTQSGHTTKRPCNRFLALVCGLVASDAKFNPAVLGLVRRRIVRSDGLCVAMATGYYADGSNTFLFKVYRYCTCTLLRKDLV